MLFPEKRIQNQWIRRVLQVLYNVNGFKNFDNSNAVKQIGPLKFDKCTCTQCTWFVLFI